MIELNTILQGDVLDQLKILPDKCVQMCVTSPPYWNCRNYGIEGQIGAETTPEEYVRKLVRVFKEVKRVLRKDGTLWLNLGDSYWNTNGFARATRGWQREGRNDAPSNGRILPKHPSLKVKDLMGVPWKVAFALQEKGWYLRSDIIYHKPNPKPEYVTDRPTRCHEFIFLLTKSKKYYYDADAIKEPTIKDPKKPESHKFGQPGGKVRKLNDRTLSGNEWKNTGLKNKRDVWTISPKPFKGAHFAVMPEALVEPCILAGCPIGGTVLDPFFGAGTTGVVARKNGRNYIGIELNPEYCEMAQKRISEVKR